MNDKDVAKKIREAIKGNKSNVLEIVIQTFADMWFQGKRFTDKDFTKKLMGFARTYDFGYVLILNQHKIAVAIRIWEKGRQIELKEVSNGL